MQFEEPTAAGLMYSATGGDGPQTRPKACGSSARSTTEPGDLPVAEPMIEVVVAPILALGAPAGPRLPTRTSCGCPMSSVCGFCGSR